MEFYFKEYPRIKGLGSSVRIIDDFNHYFGTCENDDFVVKGLNMTKELLKAQMDKAFKDGNTELANKIKERLDSGVIKVENLQGTLGFEFLKDYVVNKYIVPVNPIPFTTNPVNSPAAGDFLLKADESTRKELLNKSVENFKETELGKLVKAYYMVKKADLPNKEEALKGIEKHLAYYNVKINKDVPDASLDHNQLPESKPSTDEDVHRPKKIHGISAADITYFQRPESETKPSVNKSMSQLLDDWQSGKISGEQYLKLSKEAWERDKQEQLKQKANVLGKEVEPETIRRDLDPMDIKKEWQEKVDKGIRFTVQDVQKGLMSKPPLITPFQADRLMKAVEVDNRVEAMRQFAPKEVSWEQVWNEKDLGMRLKLMKDYEAGLKHDKNKAMEQFLRGG